MTPSAVAERHEQRAGEDHANVDPLSAELAAPENAWAVHWVALRSCQHPASFIRR
jgi:hypothetical protein